MTKPPALLRAALLALPCACAASELVVRDVTVGLASLPQDFAYTLIDDTSSRSGDDSFGSRYGLWLGADYSLSGAGDSHGLVVGARLVAERGAFADGGSVLGVGTDLRVGWGLALTDRWTAAVVGLAGARLARGALEGGVAFDSLSLGGWGWLYGIQAGTCYALGERWIVGLEGGWRAERLALTGDRDLDLEPRGLSVALVLGYRFATSPLPLE